MTPYTNRAWPAVRRTVLTRDGHTCKVKGPGCTGKAEAVDHIISWQRGGAWFDLTNLRASCTHCNSSRANRTRTGSEPETAGASRAW